MPTDLGELVYNLTLNNEGFVGELDSAKNKVKESSGEMSGSMQETEKSTGLLGGAFKSMAGQFIIGQVVFTAGQKVMEAVTGAINDGVQSAKEWQTQQAALTAALKSTKDMSGLTADQVKKLAEETQNKTAIDKAAVLTGENMLLTFTGIGKKTFPLATDAMVNMATAMNGGLIPNGQQLSTTAIQLGKALNDPTKGISALHRVGVAFTDQQKAQITAMQKAGDMAGAQSIIIKELGVEFGGRASTNLNTWTGQWTLIKLKMNDFVEMVIAKVVPIIMKLATELLPSVERAFSTLSKVASDVTYVLGMLWKTFTGGDPTIDMTHAKFAGLSGFLENDVAYPLFYIIIPAVQRMWEALKKLALLVESVLMPPLKDLWNTIKTQLLPSLISLWAVLEPTIIPLLKIMGGLIGGIIMTAVLAFIGALEIVINVIKNLIPIVVAIINIFKELYSGISKILDGNLAGGFAQIGKAMLNGLLQPLRLVISGFNILIDAADKLGAHIPHIPAIPNFASGIDNFAGGFARINEQGGEIVNLPNGSSVIPADKSAQLMKGQSGGGSVNVNINVGAFMGSDADARKFAETVQRYTNRYNRMLGA
jgi:hypothetical protein